MTVARVVLVSPHFDDVPLSLGQSLTDGFLAEHDVTVVVVFSRTNWTQWFHPDPARWRVWAVSRLRRFEEARAGRAFGYRVVTLGVGEFLLRTGGEDLDRLLDPSADVAADPAVEQVLGLLRPHLAGADAVATCAAVGHHVDHQVVREVGIRLLAEGRSSIAFYEDRPYAALVPAPELDAAGAWIAERSGAPVEVCCVSDPVRPELRDRLRRTYRSQVDELFLAAMDADLAAGARERVWVPSGSAAFWPVRRTDR